MNYNKIILYLLGVVFGLLGIMYIKDAIDIYIPNFSDPIIKFVLGAAFLIISAVVLKKIKIR